jgi:TonB-dependent receptor
VKKLLLLSLIFTFYTGLLFAQGTGKIAGKVIDQKTSETLIGASIGIQGSTNGASTNVDGHYILAGLQPGKYIIIVRYIGYQSKSISDVEVKAGVVTNLDVALQEATTQALKEVVVKATFRQASVASLYAVQKNSASISDGISSETIRKSPDRSTADVLKRVSGATIQDNKFVVIRGLSDRYNTALLDGAQLPSTEPNRKAFSFDIVPSNLVENIIISKTGTPDLPADFTGGAIQISTKDLPDQNFVTLGIGGGYNTASTFKDFKSGTRNATDYFGFDNGKKSLAAGFPSSSRIINGLTTEQNISALKKLPQDWNIYNNKALPTQNYQFTIGRVKNFEKSGNRFGAILSLTYRNSQNIYNDVARDYYDYDYKDNIYKFSTNIGALANFGYTFGKNKITFKNTYNRIYDDQFLSRTGTNAATSSDVKFFAFDFLQKSLLKSTIEGNHPLGDNNAKINWSLSYSNVLNDQPDQRKVSYTRLIADRNNPDVGFGANLSTLGKDNARQYSKLNENAYSAAVNYSQPIKMFNKTATLKTGLNSFYRDRNFDIRFIGVLLRNDDPEVRERPLSTLFGKDLINNNIYKIDEINPKPDSYSANSLTNAGYAMLDNKIGENFRVVWGARVEQFNLDLTSKDNLNKVKQNYVDVLPSANFTYSLTEKINLRASYYRTLARPEFRELATSAINDYELLASLQGNPNLKRALINNADLRFEFYPSAGQIISVSVFYKRFKDAIETYNQDAGSQRIITYFNTDKATVYGAEFEVRKTLDFIAPGNFFKNTTAYANVAIIKSEVFNPSDGSINFLEAKRPLVGQAPYVINAGLQHSFLNNKLNFNALYNKVGRRLSIAAGAAFPSVWEAPRDVIDLQLGVKVLKGKGELKFNAGDILNQQSTLYYDNNTSKKYEANADQTLSRFKSGSNYSFAFNYTF